MKMENSEIWILALSVLLGFQLTASAATTNEGDQVVVVYNTRMPGSKEVAEHYAQKRSVPSEQIFGFALTTNEDISRPDFRSELQRPLSKMLEDKKLWRIGLTHIPTGTNGPLRSVFSVVSSKIRYAALCYGVPLRISEDHTIKEDLPENMRPDQRQIYRNEAAVDSELAMLPLMEVKMNLGGPHPNWVYGTTNVNLLHPTNGILLVTRLDGPTPDIAMGLVDKAMQAENEGLWGRAYFDLRNLSDPKYKLGDEWIGGAATNCRLAGYETIVDEKPALFPASFPMSHIAFYMGWYVTDAEGPFAQPTVEFMPGAIAYHLHSFSAVTLRHTNHFWAGPFLARGVTATMGSVAEPYLQFTPDVATFTSALIFRGFTFAEAAYVGSDALSWQTTVVGDPLYRPFGKSPEQLHNHLQQEGSKMIEWSILRLANLGLNAHRPTAEIIQGLEGVETTKHSAVLQEKLGDLYTTVGKPDSAIHAYQEALRLQPSPQQKLRLLLTLGDKLSEAGETAKAYQAYDAILKDFPRYADRLAILEKALPLARKLGKALDAEKLEAEIKKLQPVR